MNGSVYGSAPQCVPAVGYTDDLSKLSVLDNDVILEEIRVRFLESVYYTFVGEVLVAVNPYKPILIYNDQFHQWYSEKSTNQKPHIFWTAHQAYRTLMESKRNQCVLINGESGAGKTENTKLIVRHLAYLSSASHQSLHDKIVRINPLLESFGNAATPINENSTRFWKFIEMFFRKGKLCRARISVYMLEKSRLVSRSDSEGNFHIFTLLLHGLSQKERSEYQLEEASKYRILRTNCEQEKRRRRVKSYRELFKEQIDLMHMIGFSEQDVRMIIVVLIAILHLTNIEFTTDDNDEVHLRSSSLIQVSALLGVKERELEDAFLSSNTFIRGEIVTTLKTKEQCETSRDALAKVLYGKLFHWIVEQINIHLTATEIKRESLQTIGILDMAGFENLPKNGLEQLCINGANEKLQQSFNEAMFEQEETEYRAEGIEMEDIHYKDNNPLVDLMFQKPTGIFDLVDEESSFPGATDASLKDKLDSNCSSSPLYAQSIGKNSTFAINHFAGKVKYDVTGMIERNRDRVDRGLIDCVANSDRPFVRDVVRGSEKLDMQDIRPFENGVRNTTLRDNHPQIARCDSRLSLPQPVSRISPAHIRSRSVESDSVGDLRQSAFISKQYRRSLSDLVNKMSDSKPWFVRCLKPNLSREPDRFHSDEVRKQIQYNGLLEVSRMRCDGYAIRMLPEEFLQRYRDISFSPEEKINPSFRNCETVLKDAGIQGYAFGKRQVFLRHWHRPILQDLVSDKRREVADEQNTAMSESEATDLDSTYDVVQERGSSNNDTSSFGTIAIKASPMEEITVETAITATSRTTPSNNDTVSTSSSRQRVSEWIEQNEQAKTDVKIPPYDPGPPPAFSSPTPEPPKTNHVRIDLPKSSERKVLDDRLWDRFQMIPRERVSTSDTFRPFLRAFKFLCYLFLFCIVLGSAVVSKICILIMTSSVMKDPKALKEGASPANTMLVISICFPYVCWVLTYSAKSLFGSSSWPRFRLVVVTLFVELLHSFGLCLLVFHILPRMDMARCLLNLCGIFTVPAFLKTISTAMDASMPGIKRFTLAVLNGIAFLIQFGNLAATTMFSLPLNEEEKRGIINDVIGDKAGSNITFSIERPNPTFGNRIMWEIPVSLFLISLSYWENYVASDFSFCSLKLPLLEWKKQLHSVRQRLYIFAGIWKIGWTMVFAVLLLPGFNFNLEFTDDHVSVKAPPTVQSDPVMTTSFPNVVQSMVDITTTPSLTTLPPTVAKVVGEESENATTTVAALSNSTLVGTGRTFVKRSISDVINDAVSKGDFSSIFNLTEDSLPKRGTPVPLPDGLTTSTMVTPTAKKPKADDKPPGTASPLYIIEIPQSVKENFQRYGPLYAQMLASALLSYFGSLACKLCMQTYGFTLPLFLATPLTLGLVLAQCYTNFIPSYLYVWLCPETTGDLRLFHLLWLCVLWISQLIVTGHIWYPKNGRMAKIERLFVIPLRCGVLTDLSMMLRRRVNDRDFSLFNMEDDSSIIYDDEEVHRADDVVPQIYACATMWHETRSEMTQLLKSLFRMDIDHSARYLAQRFYGIRDPDYYEFEAHIFFDDAMDLSDDDILVPNTFVAELIDCIDDAISSVHERQMQLGPPIRTPTPYGGRLTWKLPGGTRLLVHLKDKHKIRHKKRWSQVMYMYYLLGYRILAQPENLLHRESQRSDTPHNESDRVKLTDSQLRHRRQASHFTRSVIFNYTTEEVHTQAENTFILTLDGDVDFKPDAVRLLIDRLKKNKKVGAACGRIHPIGSGPILWYQEFEYAIGHWLQKATEHVFGCVLCAPGCFSLFRGSALMDDNVARTYAIRASEAGHYVQYDQGEDRWLSTLLLQQGYRIDYCAAADALTHAPETFSEFFNQRRRWGPSTLANIADLLGDWKNTVRLNDNISTPYVLYQFLLLVSTILGPATVLLMMAGAFTVVFKTSVISSYAIALVPPILFIVACTYAKPTTQITLATILSACYAIIMTVVLVGTVGTAIEGSLTSPNVIFLIMLVFIFFVAALMHPEEFACVIPGALYFICIPTGYLILTIYYLCNLHIVSWGTREVPKRKSKEQIMAEKRAEEEKRRKKEQRKGFLGWLGFSGVMNEVVEMFKQFRTMTMSNSDKKSKTDDLLEELIFELRQTREQKAPPRHRSLSTMTQETKPETIPESLPPRTETESTPEQTDGVPVWLKNENPNNPGWLGDPVCGDGPIKQLENRETLFWKQLLRKYLSPITEDRIHQEKVAADLKNLRNNVVFGFFMSSALWIALTMQLQLLQDDFKDTALFIKIPHFDPSKKELTFEPLGMVFLALFSSILLFQFIGMLSHRWGTILHVLSITELSCSRKFTERYKIQEIIAKAMELQRVSNIENEPEPDYDDPIPDYDDDDDFDDDEETLSGSYTDASLSTIASFSKPPSYHSNEVPKKSNFRRRNSAIFNRRGLATGRTLRRAFERRYRNQLRREKSGESRDSEGATPAITGFENV